MRSFISFCRMKCRVDNSGLEVMWVPSPGKQPRNAWETEWAYPVSKERTIPEE